MKKALPVIIVSLAFIAGPAHADYIIFGTHSDDYVQDGLSLEDVRMSVDLSVANGWATMTFTNVSVTGETAVFKEIIVDGYDNDTHAFILWNPVVLTHTNDVDYYVSSHPNGLPGYQTETNDAVWQVELQARSSPVKYGIGPGETLQVAFWTSLANGSTIQDYLDAFGEGDDTAAYSIGFHAISAEAVCGGSLSGVAVPEPATLGMLVLGGLAALGRKSKR